MGGGGCLLLTMDLYLWASALRFRVDGEFRERGGRGRERGRASRN